MLSKRERILAFAVGATFAAFVLDGYVVGPLSDGATALAERRAVLEGDLRAAEKLIDTQPRLSERWMSMVEDGLTDNAAAAEAQALSSLREWAEEASVSLSSIKPQRAGEHEDLVEMEFIASCEGNMQSVTRFLWLIESAAAPMRIEKVQILSRAEGEDNLTLTLHVSTAYRKGDDTKQARTQNFPSASRGGSS